ncbi:DUF4422 domain-containing protein [Acinetobacter pittii]|uniref:DUF4422 domain-containing protein n=1 Tax=Acinetobacter pittii TaxID=48296 RepID=UPI0030086C0B
MKTEIYVATHKAYTFPDIPEYIPIHVGKALTDLDLNIQGDNTGENISHLNKSFCELTALYWMWKNSDADIIGLAHYRRYLGSIGTLNGKFDSIISVSEIEKKSLKKPGFIILAKKEKIIDYKFFNFSVKHQYRRCHYLSDWNVLKNVISRKYPEYMDAFESLEISKEMSYYNMFISNRSFVNKYCSWLFDILFQVEKEVDISDYDDYQKRVFGFMAERLLNVFVKKHEKELDILYFDTIRIE